MRAFSTFTLLLLTGILISSCIGTPSSTPVESSTPVCGDGSCGVLEDTKNCPQDCYYIPAAGQIQTTYIKSEGVGNIAIQIAYPETPRYSEGAGVVVLVAPIFTETNGFINQPDLTSIGLIQVSYLWPGKIDGRTRIASEGEFDYGGEKSIQVLRDVIRFAAGRQSDNNGRTIDSLVPLTPLIEEIGLYAFSDAGIAAVNMLALYGDDLPEVQYLIGRENPTTDTIACQEIGHYENGLPVENPFYIYPTSYSPHSISVNYGTLRWDPTYSENSTNFVGRPYLDLDGNNTASSGDHIFAWQVPVMFGKRYYSTALTQALLDLGALTSDTWPADLASPQESREAWASLQIVNRFQEIAKLQNSDFNVMLVFSQNDNAQVAADKPHIHQAYQGFRFEAQPSGAQLRWIRLNPDRAYIQQFIPSAGANYPDNPANTSPEDWLKIEEWAYPGIGTAGTIVPLAAVAEMADRTHAGRWDENLGAVIYQYSPSTPTP